ncbi:hypothetical protein ACIQK5_31155 [Streptomyces virginiae]|uniref:hypothetical protein n=1 Tax=Streptomyces virginiae TaxID=1961 RepID=UPI00381AA25E
MNSPQSIIYVTGDPTIDWAIENPRTGLIEPAERLKLETKAWWHRGGALLLKDLVDEAANRVWVGRSGAVPKAMSPFGLGAPRVDATNLHHTYNTIKEVLQPDGDPVTKEEDRRWRIHQFFGVKRAEDLTSYSGQKSVTELADGQRLAVVVVDDAGLGFGSSNGVDEVLRLGCGESASGEPPWILYKLGGMSLRDSAAGKQCLWSTIGKTLAGEAEDANEGPTALTPRLIAVVKVACLREAGAEVSSDLSWERSAQDILAELKRNSALESLRACQRIVVSFGPTGALLIDRARHGDMYMLHFDSESMEGPWIWKNRDEGHMFGYGATLVAELAARLASCRRTGGAVEVQREHAQLRHELNEGIDAALSGMKIIYEGFTRTDGPKEEGGPQLAFPKMLGLAVKNGDSKMGRAEVPDPVVTDPPPSAGWFILDRRLGGADPYVLAERIVLDGPEKLDNVPIAKFGELVTADRKEIEGLRSLRRLITEYWANKEKTKPRSVAVFGSPGDGKSFAVREVVAHLQEERGKRKKDRDLPPLEFNLSQFSSPQNLIDAFHQVRDRCLRGEIPLVFWDEFDTRFNSERLGWLRYFLSPMQDGTFQQGEVLHPIGRAIFVFAGGTFKSFEEFSNVPLEPDYRNTKAEDFISRLSGYLDVIGPNPKKGNLIDEPARLVHRALLLSSMLEGLRKKGLIESVMDNVEYGVVRAFLEIPKYRYGARSMRAIVDMSELHPHGTYARSSLPPPTQLGLHVDAEAFTRIARNAKLPPHWAQTGEAI